MCFLHLFFTQIFVGSGNDFVSYNPFLSVSDWLFLRTMSQCHSSTLTGKLQRSLDKFPPNPILIKDSPSWGARGGRASALTSSQPPPGTRGHISVWSTGNRNHLVPTLWPCRVITDTRHRAVTLGIHKERKSFLSSFETDFLTPRLYKSMKILRNWSCFCRVSTISLSTI